MAKSKKDNPTLIRHFPLEKIPVKVRIIVIALAALLLVDIFITGYIKFAFNYIRCGHAPVADSPNQLYGGFMGYDLPGSSTYKVRAINVYYCDRNEAEADGKFPNQFSDEGRQRLEELEKQGKHPR